MKEFMLVVLFYLGGPEPQFADGFLPLGFESYQECEARRKTAEAYFESTGAPPREMYCFARTPQGDNA
jgi:hypothetical protein